MDLVQVPGWEQYPWLRHRFSTRLGGVSTVYGGHSLNLGWTKDDDPALVAENRRLLLEAAMGYESKSEAPPAITLRQIHSTLSLVVRAGDGPYANEQGRALREGDGLMTALPGTPLGIQTADCVPVIVVDPEHRAVAVFHAGWRGTAAAIVEKGIVQMAEEFQSNPASLVAAVGPSIGPCCYTVGEEVRTTFGENFPYAEQLFQDDRLDLWQANRRQLLAAGLPAANITVMAECTGCAVSALGERRYFSHRIDRGVTGRMMSVVGIAEMP